MLNAIRIYRRTKPLEIQHGDIAGVAAWIITPLVYNLGNDVGKSRVYPLAQIIPPVQGLALANKFT